MKRNRLAVLIITGIMTAGLFGCGAADTAQQTEESVVEETVIADSEGTAADAAESAVTAADAKENAATDIDMTEDAEYEDEEMFMPANFLETKLHKDIFESYDEIITCLEKGNAYAKVKIFGSDQECLMIAESAYDYGDGEMVSIEGSVYMEQDGVVKNIGNVYSSGTAYPIKLDAEGKIYSGGNHCMEINCISQETNAIMLLVTARESFDEQGNATNSGFVREDNRVYDNDGVEIAEDDGTVLAGLYDQFAQAAPVIYTVVE